jgi:hypothetical protein
MQIISKATTPGFWSMAHTDMKYILQTYVSKGSKTII